MVASLPDGCARPTLGHAATAPPSRDDLAPFPLTKMQPIPHGFRSTSQDSRLLRSSQRLWERNELCISIVLASERDVMHRPGYVLVCAAAPAQQPQQ
jgi:hypothetical protein